MLTRASDSRPRNGSVGMDAEFISRKKWHFLPSLLAVHAGQVARDGRPFSSVMMGGCFRWRASAQKKIPMEGGIAAEAPFSVAFIAKTF